MNTPPTTRVRRVALLAVAPAIALVTLAAGCGTVAAPRAGSGAPASAATGPAAGGATAGAGPATAASPVPTTTGGSITPGQPACTGWPANPRRVTLPASFVPVTVLRCQSGYQSIPGKGEWQTATLQRASQDLAPLITALRRPPEKIKPGMLCPAIAMVPPQIALIDGAGKMIMPLLPLTGCGLVDAQVLAALAALRWQPVSVRLIAQVQTPAEVATGCTPVFTDPFEVYGTPPPSAGGTVYPAPPAALRICVYAAAGRTAGAQFQRGSTVTGGTESTLLAGLSGARTSGVCQLPHSMFAVVTGTGPPSSPLVYVELGGCDRVFRYEAGPGGLTRLAAGQATAQAVAIIETVTRPKPVTGGTVPGAAVPGAIPGAVPGAAVPGAVPG